MDQENGNSKETQRHQTLGPQLSKNSGKRHPIWPASTLRKRGLVTGPSPEPNSAKTNLLKRYKRIHKAGGPGNLVLKFFHFLHNNKISQPTLPALNLNKSNPNKLHDYL